MKSAYSRVQIIINPAAGQNEPILNTINDVFQHSGVDWDISITYEAGDATRLTREAVEAGVDLIAGYGGDGTLMEIVNGLSGGNVPLAILPGGTGNAMAFELGIPRNLMKATELILQSNNRRAIDLAMVDDTYFMLRAYTGLEPEKAASREMKDRYGLLAYPAASLRFLSDPPLANYRITVDGEIIESKAMICFILNAGSIGGIELPSIGGVEVSDGLLDVFLITEGLKSMRAFADYFVNVEDETAGIYHWQGKEISIDVDPHQMLWIDGEPYKNTPCILKSVPRAVEIVV